MKVANGTGACISVPIGYSALTDSEGQVMTKIVEDGRIVIPSEGRKTLEAIRRAQSAIRSYIPEGSCLSDELIADRRRQARIE